MEIIKHGNTPKLVAVCPNCGCTFSFLETEAVREWSHGSEDAGLYIKCPECNTIVRDVHFQESDR